MNRPPASVRFILITLVIDSLGFGLVVPIVPSLVLKLSGLTVSDASMWVGGLLAAFAIMQFLCAPVLGGLSDRFGRRPVLLLSLSGICANYVLLAWAPSLTWLVLGRLIAGATAANAANATAYIADVTPPKYRASPFGLIGAAITAVAYLCLAFAPFGWVVLLGIVLQSIGAITNPAVQGMVSATAAADRQGETQGSLSSVQGLTAIVSPLVASWVFATFTGSTAPILLPGAPFVVSALAFGLSFWAVWGVRPSPALVSSNALATVAPEPRSGGKP